MEKMMEIIYPSKVKMEKKMEMTISRNKRWRRWKNDIDNDFCEILSQFLFSQNQAMTFR